MHNSIVGCCCCCCLFLFVFLLTSDDDDNDDDYDDDDDDDDKTMNGNADNQYSVYATFDKKSCYWWSLYMDIFERLYRWVSSIFHTYIHVYSIYI